MPASTQEHGWAGASQRRPDTTLLDNPNANTGAHAMTIGTRTHNVENNPHALHNYMKDNRFFPYLGMANGIIAPVNNYTQQDEENYDLPDAYKGKNNYLRDIVITAVREADMWGTSIAMPWKKWDGMEIQWDEWIFNDTLPTRTPEEAVSRLLSSHFKEHRANTVRFGIAFTMQHGFWKTEKGKKQYALQIIQIRNAIAFGAQYGVTMACLYPPQYIDDHSKYKVKESRNKNSVQNWFQNEVDGFAILQKDPDGWNTLINQLDERMIKRNQEKSDFIIAPMGTRHLYNNQSFYYLSGEIKKGGFDKTLQAGGNRMVVESTMHKMGEQQDSQDPVFQQVSIGGKFHMVDQHLDIVPLKDYKVGMLDQYIFCEDRDDMYKMSFRYAVRTMGLYTGWDDMPSKVGNMPITKLGRTVFNEITTWGEVLANSGRLDKFIKQLQMKDDDVYEDFIRLFVLSDAPEPAPVPIDELDHEEPEASTSNSISNALLNLQLQNNNAHASRLEVMMNWLQSLDHEAEKQYNIKSNIAKQVSNYIVKNKHHTKGMSEEARAFATYNIAWKLAQDLLIKYGLEVAARENRNGNTPSENYVLTKSKHRNYGGMSEQDERKLQELNQAGPYWKPVGDAYKTEVALIAPEQGAGDLNSSTKRLAFPTDAFTLASSFLCLFSVPQSSVSKMLNSQDNPNKPLFDLALEWDENAPNQQTLIDRAGLLQISIVLSAMYTIVAAGRKAHATAAEEDAHHAKVAAAWIKLANPVNMVSKSAESFLSTMEQARNLYTLDYQAPMDKLISALRDALLEMYSARADGGFPDNKSVILSIKKIELLCAFVQDNCHTLDAGARDLSDEQSDVAGSALRSVDEALLTAAFGHSGSMGAYTHSRRRVTSSTEDISQRSERLNTASKELKVLLKEKRKKALAQNRGDASGHWKPTYIKLMLETGNNFKTYFDLNEEYLNYVDPKPFKGGRADVKKALVKLNKEGGALLAELAGAADPVNSAAVISKTLTEATNELDDKTIQNIDALELAIEWTRMWSTVQSAMVKFAPELTADQDLAKALTVGSLLLRKYNTDILKTAARQTWTSIAKTTTPNEKYSQLFINTADRNIEGTSPELSDVIMQRDGAGGSPTVKRLTNDALRNHMLTSPTMSILDGFFWFWSLNNDCIQGIGAYGFRLSKLYEAGTLIMLSAWGKTGNTFHGNADMMLSDNAATQMHYGHLTYYNKSIVMQSGRITHARHCIVKSYNGGNGHLVWDATDEDDVEEYRNGALHKDIHFVPIFMDQTVDSNHMDATGRFHKDIGADDQTQKATFYPTAAIYADFWGWNQDTLNLTDASYNNVRPARENTIMFQEHQSMYNPGSGSFDLYVRDKGHWGDRVYPGCGRVRRGLESYLKPVKYDNTSTVALIA